MSIERPESALSAAIATHLRGNVVGYVALFVALSGTAWAVATVGPRQIKENAVRSKHIKAGQVTASDLAAAAVTSSAIGPGAVGSTSVLDNALTGADLQDQSLNGAEIQPGSLSGFHIQNGSLAAADLGLTAQASVNFNPIAADTCTNASLPLPGADLDDLVLAGPHNNGLPLDPAFAASGGLQVSAIPETDAVVVKVCNETAGSIDPGSQQFVFLALDIP